MGQQTSIYFKVILDNQAKLAPQAQSDKSQHQLIKRTLLEQTKHYEEMPEKTETYKEIKLKSRRFSAFCQGIKRHINTQVERKLAEVT